ncbi:MAG: DUF2298 domain-containing protein [Candidatus Micrarchaeota archaeon]
MQPTELKIFLERENALAFAIVLASLAIAFFIPAATFIVAALFAFLVPGWLLLKVLRIELALPVRCAAVVLSSVLLSTQAVYWVSLAAGYSRASILASFAALSLLFFLVPSEELKRMARREFWRAALRERARSRAGEAKRDAAAFAGALGVFVLFFAVLSASLWVVASDGSVIVGGWNYSDFFLHMGIIETVNNGNFPPQEPTFAGASIAYHWFSDLHTAFLSKASGVHPALFARFETALYCALLFLGVYSLALFFFEKNENKKWVKRAALLAAVLFVFGGSFAFTRIASDWGNAPLTELLKQSPYDNDWRFFQVPSLITGFLLVQRPIAVGLPVLALVLLLTVSGAASGARGDKKKLFLAGLLCGMAAPFQFYAFAAAALGATLWFALRFYKEINARRRVIEEYAFFFVPCAVFAAPFVFTAFARASGAGLARFAAFWLAPHGDALAFAWFYAANLGLVFLLAIAALVFFLAKPRERFNGLAFIALFALAMFAIPNVVSLSGTQWDMSKFFVFLLLACSIPAAALLARLPRALVLAAVLVCVVPGVFGLYWYGASDWRGLSASDVAAGEWVRTNTSQLSVFLAAPVHNSAVDAVGGRLRIDGYSSWMNNYGLPYAEREADLRTAFCGSASDAARVARKYDARFVWLGGAERSTYAGCGFAFASSPLFERVYDSGGVSVFQLS